MASRRLANYTRQIEEVVCRLDAPGIIVSDSGNLWRYRCRDDFIKAMPDNASMFIYCRTVGLRIAAGFERYVGV